MGILSSLQSDPRGTLIILLYNLPAILIALTLHELAHGYVALRCGDPTAQMMGRLSFNPLRHLDPIGTLFMFLFGFGWARPVPVNPRNYKNFRRDDLLVSIAGIVMNLCLFLAAMLIMTGVNELLWDPELWELDKLSGSFPLLARRDFLRFDGYNFYSVISGENVLFTAAAGENSAYVLSKGTDAFNSFLRTPWLLYVQRFLMFFARINLSLAVFNLLPIPPLDGYHVVNDIFLRGRLHIPAKVVNIVMIAMMVLLYFTRFISSAISTVVYTVQGAVADGILAVFGLG
ncbi:MAG: site-2 protease family protein [Clostridia bacterium]|nr:site-2 protease family protein [Clostridia bacterium]